MKIAIWSNAPWMETGYGTQTAILAKQLQAADHDVSVLCNGGYSGGVIRWEGLDVYGSGWSPPLGEDGLRRWLPIVNPDVIITLCDVWAMNADLWQQINKHHQVVSWVPIDRMPVIPGNQRFLNEVKPIILPMAKFGETQLRIMAESFEGLTVLDHIPHSIDCDVFRPGPVAGGDPTVKADMGIDPDRYVVGMVAMNKGKNPCRKAFPAVFLAFGQWVDEFELDDPRRPILYLHSSVETIDTGMDLMVLKETCQIRDDDIRFSPVEVFYGGFSAESLAEYYRVFDVLLSPSLGEGFGIPVIEAQACGTPVIVNNFSAQPELVGAGYAVDGIPWWDGVVMGYFQEPNPNSIINALRQVHARTDDEIETDKNEAIRHAFRYENESVFRRYWAPMLKWLDGIAVASNEVCDTSGDQAGVDAGRKPEHG